MLLLFREQVERLFPFAILVDEELKTLELGRSLRRLLPAGSVGRPLAELFTVERPVLPELTLAALLARQDAVVLLAGREHALQLRGEVVEVDGGALFVGTPWLTEPSQVSALGLTLSDFALHDPTRRASATIRSPSVLTMSGSSTPASCTLVPE